MKNYTIEMEYSMSISCTFHSTNKNHILQKMINITTLLLLQSDVNIYFFDFIFYYKYRTPYFLCTISIDLLIITKK